MSEQIFSSQARVAVMKLFLLNPDDRYYLRQAASLTGQPVRAVEREVAELEAVGLLGRCPAAVVFYRPILTSGSVPKTRRSNHSKAIAG